MEKEVLVAIVGAIGTAFGALMGNWDKIFNKDKVLVDKIEGYTPTDDFEIEFRMLCELTGLREEINNNYKWEKEKYIEQLVKSGKLKKKNVDQFKKKAESVEYTLDQFVNKILPVYQKEYTLKELHKLNKYWSSKSMRNFILKGKVIWQETNPIQHGIVNDLHKQLDKLL